MESHLGEPHEEDAHEVIERETILFRERTGTWLETAAVAGGIAHAGVAWLKRVAWHAAVGQRGA
ncbi:MAG: hypothetical protein AABZ30_14030 [Myxococcota bacterium]